MFASCHYKLLIILKRNILLMYRGGFEVGDLHITTLSPSHLSHPIVLGYAATIINFVELILLKVS